MMSNISKEWALVSGDEILLKADTEQELDRKMLNTDVPPGAEKCALPKAHKSVVI